MKAIINVIEAIQTLRLAEKNGTEGAVVRTYDSAVEQAKMNGLSYEDFCALEAVIK